MKGEGQRGTGAAGSCVCPKCGEKIPHRRGIPCQEERCPKCDAKMLREGSYHDRLLKEKQRKKQGEE
jgi:NAD-dependent SIR2 family protein deacetylase